MFKFGQDSVCSLCPRQLDYFEFWRFSCCQSEAPARHSSFLSLGIEFAFAGQAKSNKRVSNTPKAIQLALQDFVLFLPQSALFRASICAEESNLLYQFLIQMPDFSIPYYYYPVHVLFSVCFIFSFSLLSMVETMKLKLSRNKLCPSRVMSV